jgi:hypothetical protein
MGRMRREIGAGRRWIVVVIGITSALLISSVAVPAFGGPPALTAARPGKVAKKALRLAKRADRRAKRALRQSDRVEARSGPRGAQGPPGPAGPQGPGGPQGPQGPAGIQSIIAIDGPSVLVDPGLVGAAEAFCPPGYTVIGTGFFSGIGKIGFAERFGFFVGIAVFNDSVITININAQAICGQLAPGVVAASDKSKSARQADRRRFREKVNRLRSRLAK